MTKKSENLEEMLSWGAEYIAHRTIEFYEDFEKFYFWLQKMEEVGYFRILELKNDGKYREITLRGEKGKITISIRYCPLINWFKLMVVVCGDALLEFPKQNLKQAQKILKDYWKNREGKIF